MSVVAPVPERARPVEPAPPALAEGRRRLALGRYGAPTVVGGLLVGAFLVCAIFAPLIAPFDPNFQHPHGLTDFGEPRGPFGSTFLLGTDDLGRDMLSRLIYGARVAMFVAVVPNAAALLLATVVGVTAGYFRGIAEAVLMRITETIMILPTFLLALAMLAVLGSALHVIVLALVLVTWTYPARVVYGETLRLRETPFVEAARALGASGRRIVVRHVVPQLTTLLVVYFTLNAAFMVLTEAGLGYLGVGIQPPTPSWGAMLGKSTEYFFYPWLILEPGICLALLGTGFYLIGTGVRRRLEPQRPHVRL